MECTVGHVNVDSAWGLACGTHLAGHGRVSDVADCKDKGVGSKDGVIVNDGRRAMPKSR